MYVFERSGFAGFSFLNPKIPVSKNDIVMVTTIYDGVPL